MANWYYNIFSVSDEKDELKQFNITANGDEKKLLTARVGAVPKLILPARRFCEGHGGLDSFRTTGNSNRNQLVELAYMHHGRRFEELSHFWFSRLVPQN